MAGRIPEERVAVPMVQQGWRHAAFLHWDLDPDAVQQLLPEGLRADTRDGRAWISITPFQVVSFRISVLPPPPLLSSFPETNVRTYVIGPDGRDGIWFLSLDVDSALMAAVGRSAVGVPYYLASMSVEHDGDLVVYRSRRRALGAPAEHDFAVRVENPLTDAERDGIADWLAGRWRAWTSRMGRLFSVPVQHEPWPLHHASVERLDESLLAAAGLEVGRPPTLANYAPAVDARLGPPHPAGFNPAIPRLRARTSSRVA